MTTQAKKVTTATPKKAITTPKKAAIAKVETKPVAKPVAKVEAPKITPKILNETKFPSLSSVNYDKWSEKVEKQQGDQAIHWFTLGTSLLKNKIKMEKEGKSFDFKEIIAKVGEILKSTKTNKDIYNAKWATKELAQFDTYFSGGKASSYVSAIFFEMKRNGYTFSN